MDTISNKNQLIGSDTIYRVDTVYLKTQFDDSRAVEFYKEILSVQDQNFDNILTFIAIVIALVLFVNYAIVSEKIKRDAEDVIKKESEKIKAQIPQISRLYSLIAASASLVSGVISAKRTTESIILLFWALKLDIEFNDNSETINLLSNIKKILSNPKKYINDLMDDSTSFKKDVALEILQSVPDKFRSSDYVEISTLISSLK